MYYANYPHASDRRQGAMEEVAEALVEAFPEEEDVDDPDQEG